MKSLEPITVFEKQRKITRKMSDGGRVAGSYGQAGDSTVDKKRKTRMLEASNLT